MPSRSVLEGSGLKLFPGHVEEGKGGENKGKSQRIGSVTRSL